jgi:hypothetical protein
LRASPIARIDELKIRHALRKLTVNTSVQDDRKADAGYPELMSNFFRGRMSECGNDPDNVLNPRREKSEHIQIENFNLDDRDNDRPVQEYARFLSGTQSDLENCQRVGNDTVGPTLNVTGERRH